jgi:NifU-like protein involved in Fe-S cluster formation
MLERVGALPAAGDVGTGESGSLESGTLMRLQVRVADGCIAAARFKVFGCSAAIASASLVAERLEGAPLEAARRLSADEVAIALALPDERAGMARMAVEAGRTAVGDWESRQ